MLAWFHRLDAILRAEPTVSGALDERARPLDPHPHPRRLLVLAVALGATYGFFMGWFALSGGTWGGFAQLLSGMVKLPLLFVMTMVVTLPSLYVFSALMGSRMPIQDVLRMLLSSAVVSLAVAASLGPILGFFTLSTTSYAFMVLLNVALLGMAGVIGLNYMLRALRVRTAAMTPPTVVVEPPPPPPPPLAPEFTPVPGYESAERYSAEPVRRVQRYVPPPPPPPKPRDVAGSIIRVWVFICGVVGLQMAWLLRPFIGSPDLAFQLLRPKESNVFQALWGTASRLMGF